VDIERFQRNGKGNSEQLEGWGDWTNALNARENPRPVIGYIGGLHRFVDYDLLIAAARARPDWCWVFVGLEQARVERLSELANVILPGFKPHQQLPGYVERFDVCLIPYLVNESTATVSPVKLNEYLATGKPIVSTALPIVSEFNQKHKILTTVPNDPQQFVSAIEKALQSPGDAKEIERRRSVATLNDWNVKFAAMSAVLSGE